MPVTWTCPRCGNATQVATPASIPDNCGRCNYPDDPPAGYTGRRDDLEAEFGEEERRMVAAAQPTTAAAAPIDAGWLTVVLRQWMYNSETGKSQRRVITRDGVEAMAVELAEMYNEQERWPMLCGCLVGTHGETPEAMRDAHPDRR